MMRRVYELGPQNTTMGTTLGLDTLWSRYLVLHELIGITHKKKYAPVPKKAPLKMMRRVYELGPQNTKMATTLGLDTLWSRYLVLHELIGITHKKNMPQYQKKHR